MAGAVQVSLLRRVERLEQLREALEKKVDGLSEVSDQITAIMTVCEEFSCPTEAIVSEWLEKELRELGWHRNLVRSKQHTLSPLGGP